MANLNQTLVVRRVESHEGCSNFGVGAHFVERVHSGTIVQVARHDCNPQPIRIRSRAASSSAFLNLTARPIL